jgi:hypothetical protein
VATIGIDMGKNALHTHIGLTHSPPNNGTNRLEGAGLLPP